MLDREVEIQASILQNQKRYNWGKPIVSLILKSKIFNYITFCYSPY